MKIFYVCSWGGCGSKLLCRYLNNFGKAIHIHDPNPPEKLEYIGFKHKTWGWSPIELPEYQEKYKKICNKGLEWFNGIPIYEHDENEYFVIFIYRNPVYSIKSRFWAREHLENIKSPLVSINLVCKENKDLFNINSFYNNYMLKKNKNYKIYAIKYENLFEQIDELNKILNINLNPPFIKLEEKKETSKKNTYVNELNIIYSSLIDKMNKNKIIEII